MSADADPAGTLLLPVEGRHNELLQSLRKAGCLVFLLQSARNCPNAGKRTA
ncbi:hypothetical protein [Maioricimonas rarisocia]|uniref:hypothetical protein n=1 Tax=Maioricimonas rarisocia TaxID=2528026 RepID=UPI0018D26CF9|nr:hypothetical protein [Maioricimonas rarisocia]